MTRSNRRRLALVALSMTAASSTALLSACGAGQVAATANIVAAIPGGSGDLAVDPTRPTEGQISVRNAVVVFPTTGSSYAQGASAPLSLRITNSSDRPVKLVGVTAKIFGPTDDRNANGRDAGTVTLASLAKPAPAPTPTGSASATPSGSATAAPSGSASAKASAGASAKASASAAAAPSPTAPAAPSRPSLTVPPAPAGPVILDPSTGGDYLEITSLPVALTPAYQVSLVFTFEWTDDLGVAHSEQMGNPDSRAADASPHAVMAPIAPPDTPSPRESLDISPTE